MIYMYNYKRITPYFYLDKLDNKLKMALTVIKTDNIILR